METEGIGRRQTFSFNDHLIIMSDTLAQLQRDIHDLEQTKQDLQAQITIRHGQFQHLLHAIRTVSAAMVPERKVPQEETHRSFPTVATAEDGLDDPNPMEDGEL
jgi:septal ring factor EnvC (AmiA/AmiB activator)